MKHTSHVCCRSLAVLLTMPLVGLAAETRSLLDLPVSAVSNKVYLSSMTERPWWNEAWQKRVPLLVSGQADVADDKVVVDTIVDFGEPVKPEDIRVVTPWETEVECVAVKVSEMAVRLIFQTRLRVHENRPFLVYYGRGGDAPATGNGGVSPSRGGDAPATGNGGASSSRGGDAPATGNGGTSSSRGGDAPATGSGIVAGASSPREGKQTTTVQPSTSNLQPPTSNLQPPTSFPSVQMAVSDSSFRLRNGAVDVVFDRNHVTESLIRTLRISSSSCRTLLFDMANGYAHGGFVFRPNANNGWDKGAVVLDTPLAKAVRFTCKDATVTFTLYADQPRIDWAYETAQEQASIYMDWAIGTGTTWDDFFYCGKSGKILTQRAGLDKNTDCGQPPGGRFQAWLGEGWYAFGERRMADIAGLAFDVKALSFLEYGSYYGNSTTVRFHHDFSHKEKRTFRGSGAIVATLGNVEDYRKIYKRIEKPVLVSVGKPQDKVAKPYKIPRLDRDWCCDHNAGYHYGGDSGTAQPLEKDPAWARNVCERLRSYGSTVVCVMGYPWWMMPIKDKSIYDRTLALQNSGAFESWVPKKKAPTWEEMQKPGQGFGILQYTKAIHDFGMGVHTWCGPVPGWSMANDGRFMREVNDLSVDYMIERVREGQDCAYSNMIEGEGVCLPSDLAKKNGSVNYWAWKNPQEAFDAFDRQHVLMREFYTKFKAKCPDVPVFLWNSENGEIGREKFMAEDEGYFDTMVVEFCPQGFNHVKYVAKRMRGHFNNSPARTVWHHYYIMDPKTIERIRQIEWPFVAGVNGFSQENLTYETKDQEMSEITADFFRFAEYTRLGEKVAKMAPVKNVGVYRDPKMFRADVLKKRLRKPYPYDAQYDGRVRSFTELKNFNHDVIGPKYFTAKDLAQYRVVYVPENDQLTEAEAKEALAYVKAGGSLIVEGVMGDRGGDAPATKSGGASPSRGGDAPATTAGTVAGASSPRGGGIKLLSSLNLKPDTITALGKGKILWYKEVRTDRLAKRDGKAMAEVRKAIADMGGVEPFTLKGDGALDGNLQAGPEGMFLGLYNDRGGDAPATGVVTLNVGNGGEGAAVTGSGISLGGAPAAEQGNQPTTVQPSTSNLQPPTTTVQPSTSNLQPRPLFVLDVKLGIRFPLTNNTFAVSCGAQQCAYYLIGDDAFTAIPETRDCAWAGAAATSTRPRSLKPPTLDLTGFKPTVVVEFTRGNERGEPLRMPQTDLAKYVSRGFTPKNYEAKAVRAALAETKFLHFIDYDAKAADCVFADCADALKDLLKRGGTIMLSRTPTGPAAQAFFKSVDVFDPNPSATTGIGDTWAHWCGPDDHPLLSSDIVAPPKEPEVSGSAEWWRWRGVCGWVQYNRVFAKWDEPKQQRLYLPNNGSDKYAALVMQEKVLGTGRVIFNENMRAYTGWYESESFVRNFGAYILGEKQADHAKKMTQFLGGIGDVYRETREKGW